MTSYQCSFCEKSLLSKKEWLEHEKTCSKNKKTEKERFDAEMKAKNKKLCLAHLLKSRLYRDFGCSKTFYKILSIFNISI